MKVTATISFLKDSKSLKKKYVSFTDDLNELIQSLKSNPYQGDSLGRNCYKIRLAISSKGKGKSGGARVITCVKVVNETIYLLSIFDKSEKENITENELDTLLSLAGI
jgi:hypothetical protein